MKLGALIVLGFHVTVRSVSVHEQLSLISGESRLSNFLNRVNSSDAKLYSFLSEAVWARATVAIEEVAQTEADLEMGADLRADIGMNLAAGSADNGGPATLKEYCAGGQTKQEKQTAMGEGARVHANWEGYGTMYPGTIYDRNRNGTVDIKYDDGFKEKRVDVDDVKVKNKQGLLLQQTAPRDDPACKLQDFLEKLKKQLQDINAMVHKWLAAQRAKVAGDKASPPPPASMKPVASATNTAPATGATNAAPAPAVAADAAQAGELDKLKAELAERDKYLSELEKMVADNEKELQRYSRAPVPPPGISAVDDLISEYKQKIAQRDARIAELQKVIQQQQQELAQLSGKQLSLNEIDAAVRDLEKDVADAERKRDELEAKGQLDPELRYIIDSIIKSLKKLQAKVDNLMLLEEKAERKRAASDKAVAEAAARARKEAEAEGKDPEEAAKEAAEEAKRKTSEALKSADLEAMKAAQEMGKDLEEAGEGATKLDTGLHPHGDKWWRYRYEHAHIEAIVMIFVSFLMLLWSEIIRHLQMHVLRKAHADDLTMTPFEVIADDTHGAVYVMWLRDFAEQMMVCIFVFLTIWVISKTMLIDYAPMLIKPQEGLRVPLSGEEYRRLALDILTIFFIAIVFYFGLMFPVARITRRVTRRMEKVEATLAGLGDPPQSPDRESRMTSVSGYSNGANLLQQYLEKEYQSGNAHAKEISATLGGKFDAIPLHEYLTLNVRCAVPFMFKFGWMMWLPTISLFVTLLLLHRYAHMGYVRIISVFAAVVLVIIFGMIWVCNSIEEQLEHEEEKDLTLKETIHNRISTEVVFLGILQFCLFFTCYGVARMTCQPWMWELHFWPVLSLTLVALLSVCLFVGVVAPVIPNFVIAMAMPPYVDQVNWEQLLFVAQKVVARQ
jgi:hypothetical protein